jgi:hypothetical protein
VIWLVQRGWGHLVTAHSLAPRKIFADDGVRKHQKIPALRQKSGVAAAIVILQSHISNG